MQNPIYQTSETHFESKIDASGLASRNGGRVLAQLRPARHIILQYPAPLAACSLSEPSVVSGGWAPESGVAPMLLVLSGGGEACISASGAWRRGRSRGLE